MKCQKCKKVEANFHYTRIVAGKVKKNHYCTPCAEKKGLSLSSPSFKVVEFQPEKEVPKKETLAMSLEDLMKKSESEDVTGKNVCPTCGNSRESFLKKGLFGCPDCYVIFADAWMKSEPQKPELTTSSGTLKKRLDEAVKKEDYEQAARIRDEIAKLNEVKTDKPKDISEKDKK